MSAWSVATAVAIWTLILGSLAVFAWFLLEVRRLAGERRETPHAGQNPADDESQRSSTRSSSIDER